MTNTIFINIENNENNYICNICNENIENDKIIGLKCNPTKHIFCYDCIFDWYKELKFKKNLTHQGNYENNTCPICREYCGLLPRHPNYSFIPGIHQKSSIKKVKVVIPQKQPKENCLCNAKLLSKDGFCKSTGKSEFGGFCGRHKNSKKNDNVPSESSTNTLVI